MLMRLDSKFRSIPRHYKNLLKAVESLSMDVMENTEVKKKIFKHGSNPDVKNRDADILDKLVRW